MQIREGAYYRTRCGDVVGPMTQSKVTLDGWVSNSFTWHEDGRFLFSGAQHMLDLISEVYVSDTPPAVKETEAQLREMMRDPRYWRARDPEWIKRVTDGFRALVWGDTPPADAPAPEAKNLRDEFAMEAMKLLFPKHGADWVEVMLAIDAYKQADAMMEMRKK
jgi:hypothetical protein